MVGNIDLPLKNEKNMRCLSHAKLYEVKYEQKNHYRCKRKRQKMFGSL